MSQLENEITTFFSEWPDSVYVQAIPNSYERMLLHAVCQYLDLKSRSELSAVRQGVEGRGTGVSDKRRGI